MSFSSDFTLTKDENFGNFHHNISHSSSRLVRATTKTYDRTGTYIFLKLFKKKADDEFILAQKVNLTKEEFEKLLLRGTSILQPPGNSTKGASRVKKAKKFSAISIDSGEQYNDGNKENIDPLKDGGDHVRAHPFISNNSEKIFDFIYSKKNPKLESIFL